VFGYKGKQVRDNIHSHDVVQFIRRFIEAPRKGEVYNIGGGRENSISILEAFDLVSSISGIPMKYEYVDQNRAGDHICYISNLHKMETHYPGWRITKDIPTTFNEIHGAWQKRRNT
jgi:CDP-paratose 2-epimerase